MNTHPLDQLDFKSQMPFQLLLANGETLCLTRVLRLLPHRRLVALAEFRDQTVIAKIFFDSARRAKHLSRERAGLQKLMESHIPTPALHFEGQSADHRCAVLIFDYLQEAETLETLWKNKKNVAEVYPILEKMMVELATQHVLGVLQRDLHFKNFLVDQDSISSVREAVRIYTLDGGSITCLPHVLPQSVCLPIIALFLSQCGVGVEEMQWALYQHYAKARGWWVQAADGRALFEAIERHHAKRWKRYEKKIFRNCTDFAAVKHGFFQGVYDRQYTTPPLLAWLANPESVFHDPAGCVLKSGRSSTVIKVTWAGKDYVIKRYNIKHIFHWLRRLYRTTRAAHVWRLSQKLKLFGLPVAEPVAFLEKYRFGLHSVSYYVTTYVKKSSHFDYFTNHVQTLSCLLKNLAKLKIAHGDLKMKNILVNEKEEPVLIDFESAREYASHTRLAAAFRKGVRRLLKNFEQHDHLYQQFKDELT